LYALKVAKLRGTPLSLSSSATTLEGGRRRSIEAKERVHTFRFSELRVVPDLVVFVRCLCWREIVLSQSNAACAPPPQARGLCRGAFRRRREALLARGWLVKELVCVSLCQEKWCCWCWRERGGLGVEHYLNPHSPSWMSAHGPYLQLAAVAAGSEKARQPSRGSK
jgi:hypothetical protein